MKFSFIAFHLVACLALAAACSPASEGPGEADESASPTRSTPATAATQDAAFKMSVDYVVDAPDNEQCFNEVPEKGFAIYEVEWKATADFSDLSIAAHTSGGATIVADDTMTVSPNPDAAFGARINVSGNSTWSGYRKTLRGNLDTTTLEKAADHTGMADQTGLLVFHLMPDPDNTTGSIDLVEASYTNEDSGDTETSTIDLNYAFGYGPDCTL